MALSITKIEIAKTLAELSLFGFDNRRRFFNSLKRQKRDNLIAWYEMTRNNESYTEMATIIGCLLCNIIVSGNVLNGAEFVFRSNGDNTCTYNGRTIRLPFV